MQATRNLGRTTATRRQHAAWLQLLFRAAFWVAAIYVVVNVVELARRSGLPGSPDSINNLATAREILSGRGFTSRIVHQFFVYQPVPGPETVRPPGIPYLLAFCFWLFGVNLVIPVVLNGVFLVGTAICLRAGLRLLGVGLVADVAGMLAMFTVCFEPHSIWNNNAIVFCTTLLFWVGALRLAGRISSRTFAVAAGAVGAAGFLFKQTFLFTAVPAGLLLIFVPAAASEPRLARLRHGGALLATLLVLSSPYWIRNLVLFGDPVYNPMTALRVVARYGGEQGYGVYGSGSWRTVRLGHPLSLTELVHAKGLPWVLRREFLTVYGGVATVVGANPFVSVLALLSLLTVHRDRWVPCLFAVFLIGEVLFSLFYISVPPRYLWPAYPALLAIAGLGIHDLLAAPRPKANRFARACLVGAVLSLLGLAGWHGVREWRIVMSRPRFTGLAHRPPWIGDLTRDVPEAAVVLSDDPWSVWWYTDRASVGAPTSHRSGLLRVLQLHRPTHYLYLNKYGPLGGLPPFEEQDLSLVAGGRGPGKWALYRIRPEVFDVELPATIPDPPLQPY